MNFAVVKLLMLVGSAAAPELTCSPLDDLALNQRVSAVFDSQDATETAESLGQLSDYWHDQCLEARKKASSSNVRALARTLTIPDARLTVSSLLIDVEGNLIHANDAITSALSNQINLERQQEKQAYPYVPTAHKIISRSLMCLKKKAATGKRHRALCRYLDLNN